VARPLAIIGPFVWYPVFLRGGTFAYITPMFPPLPVVSLGPPYSFPMVAGYKAPRYWFGVIKHSKNVGCGAGDGGFLGAGPKSSGPVIWGGK
jgi:hypothetical protein